MKKLLLLALTVTAATSLTACGGVKEIDTLMENLVPTVEGVTANYTVNVTTRYTTGNFNIDGTSVEMTSADYIYSSGGTKTTNSHFFDLSGDTTTGFTYYRPSTFTGENPTWTEYQITEALDIEEYYYESQTYAREGHSNSTVTVYYYSLGMAIQSPFALLEGEVQSTEADFELKSKYFDYDKESDTYYFVNPTLDKEVQKLTTVESSDMTVQFLYEDETNKKLLTSVVVEYDGYTLTYTNLDNTEGSTEIIAVAFPGSSDEDDSDDSDNSDDSDDTTGGND